MLAKAFADQALNAVAPGCQFNLFLGYHQTEAGALPAIVPGEQQHFRTSGFYLGIGKNAFKVACLIKAFFLPEACCPDEQGRSLMRLGACGLWRGDD